jgi:hypothetical protein
MTRTRIASIGLPMLPMLLAACASAGLVRGAPEGVDVARP